MDVPTGSIIIKQINTIGDFVNSLIKCYPETFQYYKNLQCDNMEKIIGSIGSIQFTTIQIPENSIPKIKIIGVEYSK